MAKKYWMVAEAALAGGYAVAKRTYSGKNEDARLDDGNTYFSCPAQAPAGGNRQAVHRTPTYYERRVKPAVERVLSFGGLVFLAPLYAAISAAILIDDPDPALFKQKRVGKLLRKTYIDELPQVWDTFRGKMSIIEPRPALWNHEVLVAEGDQYDANDVLPSLTGQHINRRDELEIADKTRLDGEYYMHMELGMDVKCFAGTVTSVLRSDGVVGGGTGELGRNKMHRKSILAVCQYYYPENFQITPICEALAADGYEVTVLTGLPNYPSGTVPREYRHAHRDEMIHGVHVIRCFELGRKKGKLHLAANYASFTLSSVIKAAGLKESYDLVFCYQLSPVFMGLPARKYAVKHKIPLLLYCCDLWPESVKIYIDSESSPVFALADKISRKVYRSADMVIVQSASFAGYLGRQHHIRKERIRYIPAFADEAYLGSDFTPEDDVTDFVFLGNLGIAQDLMSVLRAVNKIRNLKNFKVHFVGDGACLDRMKQYVKENRLDGIVKFYGRRGVEEMPKFYKLADACLVSLKAGNAIGMTLPSKVQGYMAAGKPIIAMINGSAEEVIREAGCGICVSAGDTDGLSEAFRAFIEHREDYAGCGENGRDYFKKHFSKQTMIRELENVIGELLV